MDFDAADDTLCGRTGSEVRGESNFCFFGLALRCLQVVGDSNLSDPEDIVYVLNITFYLCLITIFRGRDLPFGQEPGQCSHHSGSSRSDNVVKGGSMLFLRFNFVESLDPTVDTVIDWLIKSFDHGSPCRTFLSNNFDP